MKPRLIALALLMTAFILSACNMPSAPQPTEGGTSSTLAAQTLQAMMTQVDSKSTPAPTLAVTNTPAPATPSPVPTLAKPTNTSLPPATSTSVPPPCDAAAFVSDVTVPDGTTFTPGTKFTKTWRLKNTGVCTWTTAYAAVFVDGNAMGSDPTVSFPGSVPPGEVFDLSVSMTAPSAVGKYRANFKLRNPAGLIFGTGASGSGTFYVDIKVAAPTSVNGTYSFIDNMCSADWSNASGSISCSAKDGNSGGWVTRIDSPHLENGSIDDEAALLTVPQQVNDGVIRGKYPTLSIKSGDTFAAIIGCEEKATDCNVRFQLDYQVDNGDTKTLVSWDEVYDKIFHSVTADLSSLAGKNVRFILTVLANGSASGDRALWLLPRIIHPTPTPTPTATP